MLESPEIPKAFELLLQQAGWDGVSWEGENAVLPCPNCGSADNLRIKRLAGSGGVTDYLISCFTPECTAYEAICALRHERGVRFPGDETNFRYSRDGRKYKLKTRYILARPLGKRLAGDRMFAWMHWDGTEFVTAKVAREKGAYHEWTPLYNLESAKRGGPLTEIWLTEGESDVDSHRRNGVIAVSHSDGAKPISDEQAREIAALANSVVICGDKDTAGYIAMAQWHEALRNAGAHVRICIPAGKAKDAKRHYALGGTPESFVEITPEQLQAERDRRKAKQRRTRDGVATSEDEAAQDAETTEQYGLPNDTGNAYLLRELHGGEMLFIPEYDQWRIYDGQGCWIYDPVQVNDYTLDVSRTLLEHAGELEKDKQGTLISRATRAGGVAGIKGMLEAASVLSGMRKPLSEFDADPGMAVVKNCVLHFHADGTVTQSEHSPEDYATVRWHCNYEPECASPQLDSYETLFLPDMADREFVWRYKAYCLFVKGNPEKKLFIELGPTNSGKTTLNELLRRVIGPEVIGVMSLSVLREHRSGATNPELVDSLHKRMIFTSEAGSWTLNGDTIKRATGQDTLTATLKYSNEVISAQPDFTPCVATNDMPNVRKADPATQARMIVAIFDAQVDESMADRFFVSGFPEAEQPAVLNRLIAGWAAYYQLRLQLPQKSYIRTQEIRSELSPYDIFLKGYELIGAKGTGTADKHKAELAAKERNAEWRLAAGWLYERFRYWWVEVEGLRPSEIPSQTTFGIRIGARQLVRSGKEYDSTTRKTTRFWYGIRLPKDRGEPGSAGENNREES